MADNLRRRLKPYWERAARYKRFIFSISLFFSITAILSLIPALLQRKIFDYAIPNKDLEALALILGGAVVINLFVFLFNVLGDIMLTQLIEDNRFRMKRELYRKILRLPYPFYDRVSLGEVHKVLGDSEKLSELPRLYIADLFKNIFVTLTYYPILFILNYRLTLIRLAGFPLEVVLGRIFLKRDRAIEEEIWEKQGRLNAIINESYLGVRTLKTLGGEKEALRKYRIAHLDLKESLIRRRRNSYNWSMINSLLSNLFSSVVFFWAAWDIIQGRFTFGAFIAFNIINGQGSRALSGLVNTYKSAANLLNPLERYESVSNLPTEEDFTLNLIAPRGAKPVGQIAVKNLSFSYKQGIKVLHAINMAFPAGSHTAVVGPSGSGKTTIANLLLRLYMPQEGAVVLDGKPLNLWEIGSLRYSMAVVQQETFLFEASLRENLTFGLPRTDDNNIWRALEMANAADFVRNTPGGLDAVYGTRGMKLSGGQKQRIAIARIFLRDPAIIILDEATSSQDLENERVIQEALGRLMRGRTTISIAHRLNTVARADNIYVLEKGRIVQQGRHGELIKQQGLYRRLFNNLGNLYG